MQFLNTKDLFLASSASADLRRDASSLIIASVKIDSTTINLLKLPDQSNLRSLINFSQLQVGPEKTKLSLSTDDLATVSRTKVCNALKFSEL